MIRPNNRAQLEEGYGFCYECATSCITRPSVPPTTYPRHCNPRWLGSLAKDRSPARRLEAFMRDLYMHMRRIPDHPHGRAASCASTQTLPAHPSLRSLGRR